MGRTLCIGDLHGGLYALEQLLERANVTREDKLIFLGDYVDGWETSFQLIQFLIQLNKTHECVFIKGNHDVWLEEFLRTKIEPMLGYGNTWSDRGGASTMLSYNKSNGVDSLEHYHFVRDLQPYYIDDENRLFVHGGYTSINGVEETSNHDLWWDRYLLEIAITHETKNGSNKGEYERTYPKILKKYKEIFVGHTTTQFWGTIKPIFACNLINLDTGGGHVHGVATIMDVETKNYWQSDRLGTLYPEDTHRFFQDHLGIDFT
jgi:serine/threonine protein phosphatase 1